MKKALIFSSRRVQIERGSGAHRIAHFLRQHDMDVEVIDFAAHWTLDQLKELVRSRYTSDMSFFGFSTFFSHWNDTLDDFCVWLKETYPSVPTIIGGQNVLMTPAKHIDYWIDSFGEEAILVLIRSLSGSGEIIDFEEIDGKRVIKALHSYPAYPLDSYMIKYEKRDYFKPYEFVTTELSRGCKFKCDFCTFPILGVKEDTSRSADDFREELMYNYDNFGLTRYHLADETVNDRIEKIIKYAGVVDKLPFEPWFNGFMRADLMLHQKPYWDYYAGMRFGGHYYGIETFNRESGKLIKKGMEADKLKGGLKEILDFMRDKQPFRGTISMICGLPRETEASWLSSVDWLKQNWADEAVITHFLEIPVLGPKETNHSAFSKNPEKYGFKTKKTIQIKDLNFHKSEQIYWEHDLMDLDRAKELVADFRKNDSMKFRATGWWFNRITVQEQTDDMSVILAHRKPLEEHDSYDKFVAEYVTSKLDWK